MHHFYVQCHIEKVESTMLMLVGLRFAIEDGHPAKASVRNNIPPPIGLVPNSTILLFIVIEFSAVQKFGTKIFPQQIVHHFLKGTHCVLKD